MRKRLLTSTLMISLLAAACGGGDDGVVLNDPPGPAPIPAPVPAPTPAGGGGDGMGGGGMDGGGGGGNTAPAPVPPPPTPAPVDATVPLPAVPRVDLTGLDIAQFTTENYAPALAATIELLRFEEAPPILRSSYLLAQLFERELPAGFQELNVSTGRIDRTILCPGAVVGTGSGRVEIEYLQEDNRAAGARYIVSNCEINTVGYSGTYDLAFAKGTADGVAFNLRAFSTPSSSRPFRIANQDRTSTSIAGTYAEGDYIDATGRTAQATVTTNLTFEQINTDASYGYALSKVALDNAIPNYTIRLNNARYEGVQSRTAVGFLSFRNASGAVIRVATTSQEPFLTDVVGTDPKQGQMTISINNRTNNRLIMSANNGDPASFEVVLERPDQSSDVVTVPWSDTYRFKRTTRVFP